MSVHDRELLMAVRYQAQDHRASLAHAARREDRGDIIVRCPWCACELDVALIAHAVRCGKAAV